MGEQDPEIKSSAEGLYIIGQLFENCRFLNPLEGPSLHLYDRSVSNYNPSKPE